MAIETDADRAVFLDVDEFGVEVEWPAGAPIKIAAIYDDTFVSLAAGDMEFSQAGSRYQLVMRSSDVPVAAGNGDVIAVIGDLVTGGTKQYAVLEMQPDGTGMTIVRIEDP